MLSNIAFGIFGLAVLISVANAISQVFVKTIDFAMSGAQFVFGDLANSTNFGFIFAFQVLPTIIFFASLMAVLYHLGVMQKIVQGMAWVMLKIMRISGSESLSVAANVFVGQTEAPLVVRPYIAKMTQSELPAGRKCHGGASDDCDRKTPAAGDRGVADQGYCPSRG
jgi:CNT family concentrative nucleoside transporter